MAALPRDVERGEAAIVACLGARAPFEQQLRQPGVAGCLIGTTRPEHLREAASAAAGLR